MRNLEEFQFEFLGKVSKPNSNKYVGRFPHTNAKFSDTRTVSENSTQFSSIWTLIYSGVKSDSTG